MGLYGYNIYVRCGRSRHRHALEYKNIVLIQWRVNENSFLIMVHYSVFCFLAISIAGHRTFDDKYTHASSCCEMKGLDSMSIQRWIFAQRKTNFFIDGMDTIGRAPSSKMIWYLFDYIIREHQHRYVVWIWCLWVNVHLNYTSYVKVK